MRTTVGDAENLARALLCGAGMASPTAAVTARALVIADVWGRSSHGVLRLPLYLDRFAAGGSNPRPDLRTVNRRGAVVSYDGGNGLGHAQCYAAAREAFDLARVHGVGVVAVGNSGHCGVLGLYVLEIAAPASWASPSRTGRRSCPLGTGTGRLPRRALSPRAFRRGHDRSSSTSP